MDRFVEGIYLAEIINQASAAIRAAQACNAALRANDADAVHDHIADLLNHAAVISKILKGGGAKAGDPKRVRGRHLRSSLGIVDDAPVLDRSLRDLLEHIDEQMDRWAKDAQSNKWNFVDRNIGPPGSIVIGGLDAAKVALRHLDPARMVYSVLGVSFDLQALTSSVENVRSRALSRQAASSLSVGK